MDRFATIMAAHIAEVVAEAVNKQLAQTLPDAVATSTSRTLHDMIPKPLRGWL